MSKENRYVFQGAMDDGFERDLTLTSNILANCIHSWLHLRHIKSKISYTRGMKIEELYRANVEFFHEVTLKFLKLRHYQIGPTEIRKGIEMFLETVQ